MGLIIGSQQSSSPSSAGAVRYDTPQSLTATQKQTARLNIGVSELVDNIVNDLVTGGVDKALSAEMGKQLKIALSSMALGKFYGFYATASELPSGSEAGYAYVGSENPYLVYNYNGASWTNSGTTIDNSIEIVNNLTAGGTDKALSAEMGKYLGSGYRYGGVVTLQSTAITPVGKIFVVAAEVGTYTNFGNLTVGEGELAFFSYDNSWHKEAVHISVTIVNNLTAGGADRALSAEMGKQIKAHLDAIDEDLFTVIAEEGKKLTQTGAVVDDADYCITGYIPVTVGNIVKFSGGIVSSNIVSVFFTADFEYADWFENNADPRTLTVSNSSFKYFRMTFKKSVVGCYVEVDSIRKFTWDGSTTSVHILSTIREKVDKIQESLGEPLIITNKKIVVDTYEIVDDSTRCLSPLFPIKPGDIVKWASGESGRESSTGVYNADKEIVDGYDNNANPRQITIPNYANWKYFQLCFLESYVGAYLEINRERVFEWDGESYSKLSPAKLSDLAGYMKIVTNKFKGIALDGHYYSEGRDIVNADYGVTDFIAFDYTHTIRVNSAGFNTGPYQPCIHIYNASKSYVECYQSLARTMDFSAHSDWKYLRLSVYKPNLKDCYVYDVTDGVFLWKAGETIRQVLDRDGNVIPYEDAVLSTGKTLKKEISDNANLLAVTPALNASIFWNRGYVRATGERYVPSSLGTYIQSDPILVPAYTKIRVYAQSDSNICIIAKANTSEVASSYLPLVVNKNDGVTRWYEYTTTQDTYIVITYRTTTDKWEIVQESERLVKLEQGGAEGTTDPVVLYRDLEYLRDQMAFGADFKCLFFTDIHGGGSNLGRIVSLGNAWKTKLDCILNGGDTINTNGSDSIDWYVSGISASELDVLTALGNHDVSDINQASAYTRYIKPTIDSVQNIVQPTGAAANSLCYYYKDYNSKVRVIVLDAFTPGGYWTNAEDTWLQSVLADALTQGLTVVCLNHVSAVPHSVIPCTFNSKYDVEGWKTVDAALASVQAFIDNGGYFAGWLCGHTHFDCFVTPQNYPDQPMFVAMSSKFDRSSSSEGGDQARSQDPTHKDYDSFQMVSIDTERHTLKVMRIGADSDYMLKGKHILVYDYSQKEVISNY